MTGFLEVTSWQHIGTAQMHEVGALGILPGQVWHIVVSTCAERTCTEGEAVVRVGHCLEQPFYILVAGYDTGKPKYLQGRIIGMHAHVHVPPVTHGHDGIQEVFHILPELFLVNAVIESQE